MSLAIENRKVLVLNKNWAAINVCSLKRALKLLFSWHSDEIVNGKIIRPAEPKACILDPSTDFSMYTWHDWSNLIPKEDDEKISRMFKMPEIIILSRYDKMPAPKINFNRKTIYKRDNYQCQYCGEKLSGIDCTIDHILPISRGGLSTWTNTILSCQICNSQKRNRLPEEAFKDRKNWKGPSPMKLLNGMPKKPRYNLFKGDKAVVYKSWMDFISDAYWSIELQNDNNE